MYIYIYIYTHIYESGNVMIMITSIQIKVKNKAWMSSSNPALQTVLEAVNAIIKKKKRHCEKETNIVISGGNKWFSEGQLRNN